MMERIHDDDKLFFHLAVFWLGKIVHLYNNTGHNKKRGRAKDKRTQMYTAIMHQHNLRVQRVITANEFITCHVSACLLSEAKKRGDF